MADNDLSINYESVLEDLKAKREKIDAAIRGIESMLGLSSSGPGTPGGSTHHGQDVESDSFFGMSIPDAARKYLGMKRKPQSTQDIAGALDRGGLTHQSENFGNTVGSILHRMEGAGGDVVRVGRGTWGLASWYPGRRKRNANRVDETEATDDSSE